MMHHDTLQTIGDKNKLKAAASGMILSMLALTACTEQTEPTVATLTKVQQGNIKKGALDETLRMFDDYPEDAIRKSAGRLNAKSSYELPGQVGEDTGRALTYVSTESVSAVIATGANGAELIVERDPLHYCEDDETGELAKEGDCKLVNPIFRDTGDRITFTNPDSDLIDPTKKLRVRMLKRFINEPGTYVSSIGDSYDVKKYRIDDKGNVSDVDGMDFDRAIGEAGVIDDINAMLR